MMPLLPRPAGLSPRLCSILRHAWHRSLAPALPMDDPAALHRSTVALRLIYAMLDADPSQWEQHLPTARDIMRTLDFIHFFDRPDALHDQLWFVQGLQRFAFHEPDSAFIPDVATWCLRQWLLIHRRRPDLVEALQGLGQNWLSRAQPWLARIHRQEGSSSSSGGGNGNGRNSNGSGSGGSSNHSVPSIISITTSEEERMATAQAQQAEARAYTADYVEARGLLRPAAEYLASAVDAARRNAAAAASPEMRTIFPAQRSSATTSVSSGARTPVVDFSSAPAAFAPQAAIGTSYITSAAASTNTSSSTNSPIVAYSINDNARTEAGIVNGDPTMPIPAASTVLQVSAQTATEGAVPPALTATARTSVPTMTSTLTRATFAERYEFRSVTGVPSDILISAAEAFMSLGNVSPPRDGEQHFQQALRYLREASEIPGFVLPEYLQVYLDDFGRLVD